MNPLPYLLACLPMIAAAPLAQGGAPHCAKAGSSVEKLVCSDTGLAERDRQLGLIYRAALAKATGPLAKQLRAEQRGWIKGRDACWKANDTTWITATWTVNSVPECVAAQYRLRSAELQALWRLLPARTVAYACQNNAANEVLAHFFATDPATIRLERGDQSTTLWQVGAPGAGRYEGRNISVVQQGAGLTVQWHDTETGNDKELQCKTR